MDQIPKKLLSSKHRREMWKNSLAILKKIEKVIPVSEAYVLGSFTTKKTRPADVDFILLLKTKERQNAKWSLDLVFAPENKYGKFLLEDADKWVKEKYGLKNSTTVRIR